MKLEYLFFIFFIIALLVSPMMADAESKKKDFSNKSPNDPEVREAMKNHEDFESPMGTHFWDGNGYKICGPYADSLTAEWCIRKRGWSREFFDSFNEDSEISKLIESSGPGTVIEYGNYVYVRTDGSGSFVPKPKLDQVDNPELTPKVIKFFPKRKR